MIKKTSLAILLCTFLCFTQQSMSGRTTTTVVTTVRESPSFLELLFRTNPKMAIYVTTGVILGGLGGFITYLLIKTQPSSHKISDSLWHIENY